MSKEAIKKQEDAPVTEDSNVVLRWGKIVTRIAAIGATITGAFAALFSSSSITSGVALTAAGASTLAAAEKIPDPKYIKTKHVPPKAIGAKRSSKAVLQPDILPKPERITTGRVGTAPALRTTAARPAPSVARLSTYDRK